MKKMINDCSVMKKLFFDENLEVKTIVDLCEICGLNLQEVINKKTNFVIQVFAHLV
ncbi:hypothetical protein KHA80_06470 [Anaerobacillus sp. HL2]|nr:hypothetical protein KHA80_06470 [Anaerobacillus sp. HL2]